MLALKKKREAEAKAAAEEAAAAGAVQTPGTAPSAADSSKKVSLLGVGGKKKKTGAGGANGQKKRSPGEIRIQKGEFYIIVCWVGFVIRLFRWGRCNYESTSKIYVIGVCFGVCSGGTH